MMEIITLNRQSTSDEGTFGKLISNDKFLAYTCELPWLDNAHQISCIPKGYYTVTQFQSPSKGLVFLLHDVPERDMIEVHAGNSVHDIRGCIAVGSAMGEIEGFPCVLNSKSTLAHMLDELPQKFQIHIIGVCG